MNLLYKRAENLQQHFDPKIEAFFDCYDKKLVDNAGKRKFWEDYVKSLSDIDFNFYSKKLKVPVLVPIGKKIFFRGELKHTNEVFVSLYSSYFTKCSLEQAEILKQHRIKDACSKLEIVEKEKLYLQNQVRFGGNVLKIPAQEIIEVCTEEEDKAWRTKHRENVRRYYQIKQKSKKEEHEDIADEDLWKRLEELELQEDLENELHHTDSNKNRRGLKITIENHQECFKNVVNGKVSNAITSEENITSSALALTDIYENKSIQMKVILDKQNELKIRIMKLQNTESKPIKTESDLITKLDKMGQVEEIEDEIHRLDDVICRDAPEEEDEETNISTDIKRSVTFADEDDSKTLEINFRHSATIPQYELFDPKKGILKPSDIYEAFSHLFTETTPILRKPKYEFCNMEPKQDQFESKNSIMDYEVNNGTSKVILVKDINEKPAINKKITSINSGRNRPMSVFKKRRQNRS